MTTIREIHVSDLPQLLWEEHLLKLEKLGECSRMSFVARKMIFEIGVEKNERKSAAVSVGYSEHFSFIFLKSCPKSIFRSRKAFGNTPIRAEKLSTLSRKEIVLVYSS